MRMESNNKKKRNEDEKLPLAAAEFCNNATNPYFNCFLEFGLRKPEGQIRVEVRLVKLNVGPCQYWWLSGRHSSFFLLGILSILCVCWFRASRPSKQLELSPGKWEQQNNTTNKDIKKKQKHKKGKKKNSKHLKTSTCNATQNIYIYIHECKYGMQKYIYIYIRVYIYVYICFYFVNSRVCKWSSKFWPFLSLSLGQDWVYSWPNSRNTVWTYP